jgi:Fe-S cluster assembly scaffold protein SufB
MARGLPEATARALLIEAFMLDGLPEASLLTAPLQKWLEAHSG